MILRVPPNPSSLVLCTFAFAVWGYVKERLKSSISKREVPRGVRWSVRGSYRIISGPSPECYKIFWRMIKYSDTLHWSGISPILDPVTDLDLINEFDFLPNCVRFPWNICIGCGMPTDDAYSSGHLVLSHLRTCMCSKVKPISHELVLFPDFWVLNIPQYFCFALNLGSWLEYISGGTRAPVTRQNVHFIHCKQYKWNETMQ